MEVNNGKKSNSMNKIKKRSNPIVMNSLRREVDVSVLMNPHQDFGIVKQVLIEQRWVFKHQVHAKILSIVTKCIRIFNF